MKRQIAQNDFLKTTRNPSDSQQRHPNIRAGNDDESNGCAINDSLGL